MNGQGACHHHIHAKLLRRAFEHVLTSAWQKGSAMIDRDFATFTHLPVAEIGRLQPGRAIVKGRIIGANQVARSPLSNAVCAYYWFRVSHVTGQAGEKEVARDAYRADTLSLADETGTADVFLEQADILVRSKYFGTGPALPNPPEGFRQQLWQRYSIAVPDWPPYTFQECSLRIGDEVIVAGDVAVREANAALFKQGSVLLVATTEEASFYRTLWWRAWWKPVQFFGVLLVVVSLTLIAAGIYWDEKPLAGLAGIILTGGLVWLVYMQSKLHGIEPQ